MDESEDLGGFAHSWLHKFFSKILQPVFTCSYITGKSDMVLSGGCSKSYFAEGMLVFFNFAVIMMVLRKL